MNRFVADLTTRIRSGLVILVAVSGVSEVSPTFAVDLKDAKDHPIVSRFEGSEIINYNQDAFNGFTLFTDKANVSGGADYNAASTMSLEGRVTTLTYRNPPERTTLEVFRNYENALIDAAFEMLYTCTNNNCGGRNFSHAVTRKLNYIRLGESYADQRYLSAKLSLDEGDVFVSLFVAMASVGGGADFKRVITQLDVIEVEGMQENMVEVDANAMARSIGEVGRVALYGILFDLNLAVIKPASKPTLEQIAALLNDNPDLNLVVVGHTDNQGSFEYNMDLSKRRAKAVETELATAYGISEGRLSAWGVGYLSPVASNRNDTGRSMNRRVELIEN